MALTVAQYQALCEEMEQTITSRNIEEYLIANPGPFPPQPDPTYAQWSVTGRAALETCLSAGAVNPTHAAIVTTNGSGLATFTYASTATPVVAATVVDTTADNVFYQVALVSLSATQAVVRVTQNTSVVLLGISLLTVPTAAVSVPVHIIVTPTA